MDKNPLIAKVMEKPELKMLPVEDVERALRHFIRKQTSDEEKIRLTRELLHKTYGAFGSRKLFSIKDKPAQWILQKHLSTRERLPHYKKVYERILRGFRGTIIDLGAGVNGFSLEFMPKAKYVAVEGVGQLVDLMNNYFKKSKFNAKAIHLSLFDLENIGSLIKKEKGKKAVLLFKVLDSLEMLERDYSKKLLERLVPLVDQVTVSVATRSMIKRTRFDVDRSWLIHFIKDKFTLIGDFEIGGERYFTFSGK